MSEFLSTHTLALTPLAPIHIGCGADFEPTNYVIEDGLLYGFDPSRAALTEVQRSKLRDAARRGSLAVIQRFFRDNAAAFKPHAHVVMPVCTGVARLYELRIGKTANVEADGKQVFNKLEIERHVYTGALQQPFIPGTSFKGALRTAWLDGLNAGSKPRVPTSSRQFEEHLLEGDFQTSPLRLLKVADLMPSREPEREVLFAVNRKKKQITLRNGTEAQPKGLAARKDCVLPGQYRLFQAQVTLPALLELSHVRVFDGKSINSITPKRHMLNARGAVDLVAIAKHSNKYHLKRLKEQMIVLQERGLLNPDWKSGIEALLAGQLGQQFEAGKAFLVCLGRYGGAEHKTLSGKGVASIKIMGAKGERPTFESTTKTVWLAAQNEDDQKHLIPFGWAVVEIDPTAEHTELKNWCTKQSAGRPDMAAVRANLQVQKQAASARKAQLAAAAAQRLEAAQAQRLAALQREQAIQQLSVQGQQVEALRQKCADWAQQLPPKGNYKKIPADPGRAGLYQEALQLVKAALEGGAWTAPDQSALADMLETSMPQIIDRWDAKEHKKRLKLAALRGQS